MRTDGYIIINEPSATIEYDTVQCVHCQSHFIVTRGSKKKRGFCLNRRCMGPICGRKGCRCTRAKV